MRQCRAVGFIVLLLCVQASAQTNGILQCDVGMKQIPAWIAPGSAYVMEQLPCGQAVSIIEADGDFYKLQLGNGVGYVHSKFVKVAEELQPPAPGPVDQQNTPSTPMPSMKNGGTSGSPSRSRQAKTARYEGALAIDLSQIRYEELSLTMKERGRMWGVSGEFVEHRNKFMFKIDARFSMGEVDYASPSGEFEGIRDYQFETRYSFGFNLKKSNRGSLTPFIGVGYRFLHDNLDEAGPGGYDRKSKYLYSPIGMESLVSVGSGWRVGVSGEYDLFWHGWQSSEIGDFCPDCSTLKNNQNKGWGARGSIRIVKELGKMDFIVEPFFRYWDIQTSDLQYITYQGEPVGIGWEPANTSREWGARVGIGF